VDGWKTEMNEEVYIECLGDICPVPLMKLKRQEASLKRGDTIKLVTDHSCVSESIRNYCVSKGYQLEIVEPINGVWEFYISE